MFETSHPRTTELIVTVKDAQGQPVNGVPVAFEVEPEWAADATVASPRVVTQEGRASTVLEAETTGLVHVMARVENVTETIAISVSPPPEVGATSSD